MAYLGWGWRNCKATHSNNKRHMSVLYSVVGCSDTAQLEASLTIPLNKKITESLTLTNQSFAQQNGFLKTFTQPETLSPRRRTITAGLVDLHKQAVSLYETISPKFDLFG